jgi:PAS domain S-box-containing protein
MKARLSDNETERLKALRELCILDTEREGVFDDLVEIASQICGTPIALVSLVDEDRQWFKAKKGLEAESTPRELAFCAHAILTSNVLVVNDAKQDARFSDNPLVTSEPHIQFYVGAPLITKSGYALGTLCAIDTVAKQLTAEQIRALQALSRQVVSQFEFRLALRESDRVKSEFKTLTESSPLGVFGTDPEGNCTYVNPAYRALTGLTDEQCRGTGWVTAIHPDDRARVLEEWDTAAKSNIPCESTHRFLRPDGHISQGQIKAVATHRNGEITGYVGTAEDITERTEFLNKLKEQERHLSEAQTIAKLGSWSYNLQNGSIRWSDESFKIFGIPKEQGAPTYEQHKAQIHPHDRDYWERVVVQCLKDGAPFEMEFRIVLQNEEVRHIHSRGLGEKTAEGTVFFLSGTVQDITDRKNAEQNLAHKSERLELALKGGDLGLWDWDVATSKVIFNERWATMLGERLEDLEPGLTTWESRAHPDDIEWVKNELRKLLEGKTEQYESKHRLRHKDGSWRWILDRGKVMERDSTGAPLRVVGTHLDCTAEVEAEEARKESLLRMKEAEEQAISANRTKSEFLANMSHEIRTPMNGIIGMTEMLLDNNLTEEQRDIARDIDYSAKSLLGIINDILDLSKVEAGKIELSPVEFGFTDFIDSTLNILQPRVTEKQITLITEIDKNIPPRIVGDDTRIRQVLLNIAGNAVKFTPNNGGVAITAQLQSKSQHSLTLRFSVSDTGIGIPAEKLEMIFSPFSQADGSTTRNFGGTGLGLTISKKIVELMGGSIWIESRPSVGSVFHFNISVGMVNAETAGNKPTKLAASHIVPFGTTKKPSLLLVEDNLVNQKLAKMILEKMGCTVDLAANGQIAVDKISADPSKFDLVLMDCQMPVLSGFDATREIRKREEGTTRHIPIVAMTANVMEGDEMQCRNLGMDDYVAKPIDRAHLRNVLGRFLGGNQG